MSTDKTPLDAHAIELVKELAVEAAAPEVLSIAVTAPGLPAEFPVAFDRKEQTLESVKSLAEEWRVAPPRRKGTAKVDTLRSFIELTNRHKDDHSVLFGKAQMPEPSLTAVLDYHQTDGGPRFGDHRIRYAFPLTDEFKAWMLKNGAPMEQADFAQFLEDHAAELAAPMDGERTTYEPLFKERFATPTELIMLSRHLEVNVGQRIKRQERLQSGERVVEFTSEHTDARGEKIDIPGVFMVSVPAFIDDAAVRIPARLRYRAGGQGVIWFYSLYRPDAFLREQVKHDLFDAANETGLPAYEGAPEA